MVPMTELDAVNTLLGYIGEQPVSTVNDSEVDEANIALGLLRSVSRDIQAAGMSYNREEHYPLSPNDQGEILVPYNALIEQITDQSLNLVQRGAKIYDKENHTFRFTKAVEVTLIWLFDYDELPQDVKKYIAIRAGREFIKKFLGSDTLSQLSQEDEQKALVAMQSAELKREKPSMRGSNSVTAWRGSVLGRF